MTDQIPQMQLVEARKRKRQTPTVHNGEPSVAMMLNGLIESVQKGETTPQTVEVLKGMMDLYERTEEKKAEKDFSTAFSKLQSKTKRIQATHPVPAKDGTIKYKVAKFQEVWNEVEPYLFENGFTASFAQRYEDGLPLRVTTIFILQHTESGHKKETPFTVRVGNGPPGCVDYQADGAASSYAKMRAVCSALNIIIESGEDDAKIIGTPIGKALAEDLEARVKACGADSEAFLKYAGANSFAEISDERWPMLDELLKRKELKQAAQFNDRI